MDLCLSKTDTALVVSFVFFANRVARNIVNFTQRPLGKSERLDTTCRAAGTERILDSYSLSLNVKDILPICLPTAVSVGWLQTHRLNAWEFNHPVNVCSHWASVRLCKTGEGRDFIVVLLPRQNTFLFHARKFPWIPKSASA